MGTHLSEEITVTPPSCAVFMFYSASFQCLCFSSELDEFCSLVKEAFFFTKDSPRGWKKITCTHYGALEHPSAVGGL